MQALRASTLALLVLGAASSASAQVADQPPIALAYNNLFAARYNPLGLIDLFRVSLRYRLYEHDSDLLKQNFLGIGATAGLTPTNGRFGILAEVQPLTILQLYAQYELVGYFGVIDTLASFPSAADDFSDTNIEARGSQPGFENYATYGGQLTLGATVQVKLGPVAARNMFRAIYFHYRLRDGDHVFYDLMYDMLMPNEGWMAQNDLDVLAVIPIEQFQLAAGARWSYLHSFYDAGDYAPGTDPATVPDNDIHRLGPLVAFTIEQHPNTRFDRPTIVLIVQWHLVHRWRTGADVDTGVPYLGLAFTFEGDLLAPERQPAPTAAPEPNRM
jgi:hypothetical protein